MHILNIGSLSIGRLFYVPHLPAPGEVIDAIREEQVPAGKGGHQSAAIARAGGPVRHVGSVGIDGLWIRDYLHGLGVDTGGISTGSVATGQAITAIDPAGEHSTIVVPGGNHLLTPDVIDAELEAAPADTMVLLQNEVANVGYVLKAAARRSLRVCFNPSPMSADIANYPLADVTTLVLNDHEARMLIGSDAAPDRLLETLIRRYPSTVIILTLGPLGAVCFDGVRHYRIPAVPTSVVDTTAAGDTFVGYYLARRAAGDSIVESLQLASTAASLTISRPGATRSLPSLAEVLASHDPDNFHDATPDR